MDEGQNVIMVHPHCNIDTIVSQDKIQLTKAILTRYNCMKQKLPFKMADG